MLSKKQREKEGWTGIRKLVNVKTGEIVTIDFDETPIFSMEEVRRLGIGQPDMKPYSEMTEKERRFSDWDVEDEEDINE